jgi:benzyl alcohol O-benzoyltransferase
MERLKQNVRKELAGAHVDDVETAADESNMHGGGVLAKL